MKKILKSLVISMIIVCSMAASIFATSAEDIKKQLLSIGVPSPYVGAVVEYLQKTTISQAEYNKVVSYINEAKDIIGDVKDISALSDSDKLAIKNLATQAGNTLGLEVTFGSVEGVTTLIITDTSGNTIVKMDTLDVIESVTNFNPTTYVELVEEMVEYSNNTGNGSTGNGSTGDGSTGNENAGNGNTGNGEFEPVGGELNQTATPYGNMMVVGLVMIISGAGIALVAKKQFA